MLSFQFVTFLEEEKDEHEVEEQRQKDDWCPRCGRYHS